MRRSSLLGLKTNLDALNLNDPSLADNVNSTGEVLPAAKVNVAARARPTGAGVNSLAIAAARSKRRIRRADPSGGSSSPLATASRRGRSGSGEAVVSPRRRTPNQRRVYRPPNVGQSGASSAADQSKPTRRESAEKGKLLFAAAAAAAATTAPSSGEVPLPAASVGAEPVEVVETPTDSPELVMLRPSEIWKCVDPRGAFFRSQPSPDAVVGDGSGTDPGETIAVMARTDNWLKLDTSALDGVKGSRWAPRRMYWGDHKVLFAKVTKRAAPPTRPRSDTVVARLSISEFNSLKFDGGTPFPVVTGFRNSKPEFCVASGHRLIPGMALLSVAKWSLVRSKIATIAAMLNARPDSDTAEVQVSLLWPTQCTLPSTSHVSVAHSFCALLAPCS